MFTVSSQVRSKYPQAYAGILVVGDAENPPLHPYLEEKKRELVVDLRARYAGLDRAAISGLPILQAYNGYYRSFGKTYHVQLQLESVVMKGKSLPAVTALVDAMFMAEMKNLLLTAGHDLEKLDLPIRLDVASGAEGYVLLRGEEQTLKPGDLFMADRNGVISSILYGPDQRTQITANTRSALYAVYAPAGIPSSAVEAHLADLRDTILGVSPLAQVYHLGVYGAEPD